MGFLWIICNNSEKHLKKKIKCDKILWIIMMAIYALIIRQ